MTRSVSNEISQEQLTNPSDGQMKLSCSDVPVWRRVQNWSVGGLKRGVWLGGDNLSIAESSAILALEY